jgi:hypothetical protein
MDAPGLIDANWGIVEETDDAGNFAAFHIVPMVTIDGDVLVSAAHDITKNCPCGTHFEQGKKHKTKIWIHYDPDHAGALMREEPDDKEEDNHGSPRPN